MTLPWDDFGPNILKEVLNCYYEHICHYLYHESITGFKISVKNVTKYRLRDSNSYKESYDEFGQIY